MAARQETLQVAGWRIWVTGLKHLSIHVKKKSQTEALIVAFVPLPPQ